MTLSYLISWRMGYLKNKATGLAEEPESVAYLKNSTSPREVKLAKRQPTQDES